MNLSTLESIKETLAQLESKEQQLESEIGELLDREPQFQQSIKQIYAKMPDLNYLLDDTKQLSNKISVTSTIATNVSSKIRKLDCAKERVAACLQRIGDILDLKFCNQNIEKALAVNDYEKAAAHIHRFLSIDENNLKKSSLFNENLGLLKRDWRTVDPQQPLTSQPVANRLDRWRLFFVAFLSQAGS